MHVIDKFLIESESKDLSDRKSVKVLVSSDNKLLFLRIQNGCGGAGKWDLPGGGIEPGEKEEDAAIREVFEETSLKITDIKKLDSTARFDVPESKIHTVWKFYKAAAENSDVHMNPSSWKGLEGSAEHNEYKWVSSIDELNQMDMLPEFKKVAKMCLMKMKHPESDISYDTFSSILIK